MQCTEAFAFEAAAALDAYEEQLLAIRHHGADPLAVARIQKALRQACGCCLRLPQLAGPSVSLLLAHHRLFAQLAPRAGECAGVPATIGFDEVEGCIASLHRACRDLFLAPHLH